MVNDLRPCERLAHAAALEESASLDAQGIDHSVVTYREQGQCLLLVDGKIEAWTFAVTDEEPALETASCGEHERRLAVAAVTKELEAERG